MEILDLRQVTARDLEQLFEEQQVAWREQLRWDYKDSVATIRRFVDARTLPGYVAMENRRAVGYSFFVYEDHKGLVGDLYVSHAHAAAGAGQTLLTHTLETLQASPNVRRIEAQLIPFHVASYREPFAERGFRLFPRNFMIVALDRTNLAALPVSASLRIEPWRDRHFEKSAQLIVESYLGHIDSQINDQYSSQAGALKFLKNIIVFPGCGMFQTDCSFVATEMGTEKLAGVILSSKVAEDVGHVTQICVVPEYRGFGLGSRLLAETLASLRRRRCASVSLTVTAANPAVRLYERVGFATMKRFDAAVWNSAQ
jgi:ribosomal protein S18 acetylase RimI-like enzyme